MNTEFIFEFEFYDLFNGKIPEYTILTLKTLTNCSLGPRKDIVAIWNTRIIIILYNNSFLFDDYHKKSSMSMVLKT